MNMWAEMDFPDISGYLFSAHVGFKQHQCTFMLIYETQHLANNFTLTKPEGI